VRGGIYDSGLFDFIIKHNIQGHGGVENFQEMYRRDQNANSTYWLDKRANISGIEIPTYITASYTSFVHTMGSLRGYMQINTQQKWLRICPWQEWYCMWNEKKSADELARFFDRFLNDTPNDWESTPRVRSTILRFNQDPIYDIEETDFPIPRTQYRNLYFSDNNSLSFEPPKDTKCLTYDSEKYLQHAAFTYKFAEKTRLNGIPKAIVFMSTSSSKDMDVYVLLRKLDINDKPLVSLNIPWSSIAEHGISPETIDKVARKDMNNLMFHIGSIGILRASRRSIDPSKSIHENYPFHPHDRNDFVEPEQIVKMEIGIWAMGVEYDAGESIRVEIHGNSPLLKGEFDDVSTDPSKSQRSQGMHNVYFGAEYPSHVVLPFV
jgi:predicted acyl esterase